ncbi:MAG: SDR family oxidoreductase [Sedimentisphaerales bacterium]|nr:SDR family oxidoreductase [Sedimentisphaerales bacterium]
MNVFSLADDRAIVTGGGSGLGAAIAECLVSARARVLICGRHEDALRRTCARLGARTSYLVHDVTDVARSDRLMEAAAGKNGGPATILINNAGIHLRKPAVDESPDELRQLFDTHVLGATSLARAVAPSMIEQGKGSIVFITSMAALFGIPQVAAYSAAKSALLGLVRALAVEWSPHGVRVNAIAPGWIDTPMLHRTVDTDPHRKSKILARTPLGRFGEPSDVGWAAVYLCSPQAKFVTGQQLVVDGGVSIGF